MAFFKIIKRGVRLAVAHSAMVIGTFGGLLESISKVQPSGNKIDNMCSIHTKEMKVV